MECKDGISLDELAYKFSKNIKDILINKTYIIDKNIVSSSIVNLFEEFMGSNEKYDEKSLLALMVFKEMIDSGFLSMDEMKKISSYLLNEVLLLSGKMHSRFFYRNITASHLSAPRNRIWYKSSSHP